MIGFLQSVSDHQSVKQSVLLKIKDSDLSYTCLLTYCYIFQQYPEQEGKSDGTETTANLDQKLFYHRLGTKQSEDILVAEFPDNPKWMM